MLELKPDKPQVLTPLRLGIIILFVVLLWTGLQITLSSMMSSLYFRFALMCILGFGFLIISFLLKYG